MEDNKNLDVISTETMGDVYFDTSPFAYTAPKNDVVKDYLTKRQDNFIVNRQQVDAINLQKKIDYNSTNANSQAVFNNLSNYIDEETSKITNENMADKTLDIDGISRKAINDLGLLELQDEYKRLGEKSAEIETKAKDYKDPGHVKYLQDELYRKASGVTMKDGVVQKSVIGDVPVPEFVAIGEHAMGTAEGWMADTLITRNPDNTVNVDPAIRGYLTLSKTESVTPEELTKGLSQYYMNDVKTQAYLSSFADYQLSLMGDPASYLANLSEIEKQALFGNIGMTPEQLANLTEEDIKKLIGSPEDLNVVAKNVIKAKEIEKQIKPAVEKFSYVKEDMTTLSDTLLLESIKAGNKRAKAAAETSNVSIVLGNLSSKTTYTPDDIIKTQELEVSTKSEIENLRGVINNYQQEIKKQTPGYTQEQLNLKQEQLGELNMKMERIAKTKDNFSRIVNNDYQQATGKTITADYQETLPEVIAMVKAENTMKLLEPGVLPTGRNNTYRIKLPKDSYFKSGTSQNYIVNGKSYNYSIDPNADLDLLYIDENGDAYISNDMYRHKNDKGESIVSDDVVFNENGEFTENVFKPVTSNATISGMNYNGNLVQNLAAAAVAGIASLGAEYTLTPATDGYVVGTEDDVTDALLTTYANEENTFYDKQIVGENKIVHGKILGKSKAIKAKFGSLEKRQGINEITTLTGAFVTGATSKNPASYYVNLEKGLKDIFEQNREQFVTRDKEGNDISIEQAVLADYPDLKPEHIDWKATKESLKIAFSRDVEHGQNYAINVKLTKEGKEEAGNPSITYAVNRPLKNRQLEDEQVARGMQALLKDTPRNSPNFNILAKEVGSSYLSVTPDADTFDKMHLYTMLPGDSEEATFFAGIGKPVNVKITSHAVDPKKGTGLRNTDFTISTVTTQADGSILTKIKAIDEAGREVWVPEAEATGKDSKYKPVLFDTPDDIKGYLGSQWLQNDTMSSTALSNVPEDSYDSTPVSTDTNFKTISENEVRRNDYRAYVANAQAAYPNVYKVQVERNGEVVTINSRIPQQDITYLSKLTSNKNQIASGVNLPYVHKYIAPNVKSLLADFPSTLITGASRTDKAAFVPQSADNSLHKYGFGLDLAYNKENIDNITQIKNNKALLDKYGILSIKVKPKENHIHVEFKSDIFNI